MQRPDRYLLSYDPLAFHAYLETIVASNSSTSNSLLAQQNQSPWLFMDAAHTIFSVAKRRCYVNIPVPVAQDQAAERERRATEAEQDAGWEALDEIEGITWNAGKGKNTAVEPDDRPWWEKDGGRPLWLPKEIEPVLEEPPKWGLLGDILLEIEQEINDQPGSFRTSALLGLSLDSRMRIRPEFSAPGIGYGARHDFF